jgi:O-6-methylguanine DNA methyltransferase
VIDESRIEPARRAVARAQPPPRLAGAVLGELALGHWYAPLDTVVGRVNLAYGPHGLVAIRQETDAAEFEAWFARQFGRQVRPAGELPATMERQVRAALEGGGRAEVDLSRLTAFEKRVLEKTSEIPRGEVRTYSWVAKEIGHPAAVRAVGSALARNPVPLVIPCHRVVRSDWRIGEYGCGGPPAKRAVLAWEGVDPVQLEELAGRGVRFQGSRTTHVYCLPTCRNARRISRENLVEFRSEAQALASGYRGCRVCRPERAAA